MRDFGEAFTAHQVGEVRRSQDSMPEARGGFERRLVEQESAAVAARAGSGVRRGRGYVPVVIAATAATVGVAGALGLAWRGVPRGGRR